MITASFTAVFFGCVCIVAHRIFNVPHITQRARQAAKAMAIIFGAGMYVCLLILAEAVG